MNSEIRLINKVQIEKDVQNISGVDLLNEYYLNKQKTYINDSDSLMLFQAICFILSYKYQAKLKNTLFKSNYSLLKNCKKTVIRIFHNTLLKDNIKFLLYCCKIDIVPFFLYEQVEIPKLVNELILLSLKQKNKNQMKKHVDIINFIRLYNSEITCDIDYINNKISKQKKFKYWQATDNIFSKTEGLIYKLVINKEVITTSLVNAINWNAMETRAPIFLNEKRLLSIQGYDQKKYNNLLDFISSFTQNTFVNEHINNYFLNKIESSTVNKQEWLACSLSINMPAKKTIHKMIKI